MVYSNTAVYGDNEHIMVNPVICLFPLVDVLNDRGGARGGAVAPPPPL